MAGKHSDKKQRKARAGKKASTGTSKGTRWWVYALIPALLGVALYAGTANHGYVLDDESAITKNNVVMGGTKDLDIIFTTHYRYGYWANAGTLYRPLALALFAVQWEMAPNEPGLAHKTNIFLYGLCGFLLFLLLFRWFGRGDPWLPLIITVLFIAHPIHTEVVANIKSADELLAFALSLGALLLLWQFIEKRSVAGLIGSLLLYGLAMFSKESVITLLAVIPLAMWFFTTTKLPRIAWVSALFLVPVAIYMGARVNALGVFGTGDAGFATIDNMVANMSSPAVKIATTLKLCGLYLWKMVVPHPLSHDYSLHEISQSNFADWRVWASVVAYVGMGVYALIGLKKRAFLSFAILFFLATFSLYSNLIVTIGTHFGERLLFLPSLGFAMAVGYGLWYLGTKTSNVLDAAARFQPAKAIIPLGILVVVAVSYSFKTLERAAEWEDEIVLFDADRKNAPNSSRTHFRYGRSLMTQRLEETKNPEARQRLLKDAIGALTDAVAIVPTYAEAQGELGLAWARLGVEDSAAAHYDIALEWSPTNYTVLNNYGSIYFNRQDFPKAKEYFALAVQYNPRYIEALGNLASVNGAMGNYQVAIDYFKQALELAPNTASYHYYIGLTYQNMGDAANAEPWLQKACQLAPGYCPK